MRLFQCLPTHCMNMMVATCHFVGCKIKRKKVPVWDYLGHTVDREIFTFRVKNFRVVKFSRLRWHSIYPGFLRLTNLEIHADRLFAFLIC